MAFCIAARDRGFETLQPFPDPVIWEAVTSVVRPLFTEAELDEVKKAASAAQADAETKLSTKDPNKPKNLKIVSTRDDAHLLKFERRGAGANLEYVTKRSYNRSIGDTCVGSAGGIGACPTMAVKKTEIHHIDAPSWPASLVLEDGDALRGYGEITDHRQTGVGTPVEKHEETIVMHHVISVEKKDGTKIDFTSQ